ncbi:MAG TPA: HNH endonuclease signature motif containing protein [Prosthecobacter sp.]
MSLHIPATLRQRVWERASGLCELCLLHEHDDWLSFQIDHLISRKHGGRSVFSNLALDCNLAKGSDLGSLTSKSGMLIPFFNPRKDRWADHFRLNGARIIPLSDTGEVTSRILAFNSTKRLLKRREVAMAGRYPSIEALALLRD